MTPSSTGRVVVVHRSIPAGGAPDPRDRQVLRRVLDLATAARECVLVAEEPPSGSASCPEVSASGVRCVPAVAAIADVLRQEATDAVVIVATDARLARDAMRVCPEVPCVIDLAELPSQQIAATREHFDV